MMYWEPAVDGRATWYGYREPGHHELVGWIVQQGDKYVIDTWKADPPPGGPFATLEAAKLAAEMLYG